MTASVNQARHDSSSERPSNEGALIPCALRVDSTTKHLEDDMDIKGSGR